MSSEAKQQWKNLAEEEKIRHQQQYPDYRYQPRRYGKNNEVNTQGAAFTVSNGVTICNRCNGKVMNMNAMTPIEMPTPAVSPDLDKARLEESNLHIGPKKVPGTTQLPLRTGQPVLKSRPHIKRPKSLQINTGLREYMQQEQADQFTINPLSPGQKRRRPSRDMDVAQPRIRSPMSPPVPRFSQSQQRRLNRPHSYSLILPIRSQPFTSASSSGLRGSTQQQHHSHLGATTRSPPLQSSGLAALNDQEKAEIQGIPFLNKIKLLSIIAPPVGADPKNPDALDIPHLARERGGALIAVEGESPEAVRYMIRHLEESLSRNESHIVKVFDGPEVNTTSQMPHEDLSLQYLDIISAWRKISYQVVNFITGSPASPNTLNPPQGRFPGVDDDASRMPSIQEIMKQGQDVHMSNAGDQNETPQTNNTASSGQSQPQQPFRIAIVPRYQFTNSEKYACTAPINDSYTPHDHWQWMASLWRYCAGPDLTIYVRDCGAQEVYENNSNDNSVDVRLVNYRTLVVRRRTLDGTMTANTPTIEERALRRVAFEVGEYFKR